MEVKEKLLSENQVLINVCEELNHLLEPKPRINVYKKKAELKKLIFEAADLLEEEDNLSPDTIKLLEEMGCLPKF